MCEIDRFPYALYITVKVRQSASLAHLNDVFFTCKTAMCRNFVFLLTENKK